MKRRTIDELKALYEKKECDICGNKVSALDKIYVHDGMICRNCEKLLRPYFKIYSAEHAATIAVNVVNAAINIAFDNTVMDMCEADDPLKKSDIASLKEIYELIKSSEQGK
ncbi:MAG: DUF4428 domain-containing protein [Ruminiclostridium sp.]|nr:DUF4428 domain-containing protein [Ruminiclostridium sp.]